MTKTALVEIFLDQKQNWFDYNEDSLFPGLKYAARDYLRGWVETGAFAPDVTDFQTYIKNNFHTWVVNNYNVCKQTPECPYPGCSCGGAPF